MQIIQAISNHGYDITVDMVSLIVVGIYFIYFLFNNIEIRKQFVSLKNVIILNFFNILLELFIVAQDTFCIVNDNLFDKLLYILYYGDCSILIYMITIYIFKNIFKPSYYHRKNRYIKAISIICVALTIATVISGITVVESGYILKSNSMAPYFGYLFSICVAFAFVVIDRKKISRKIFFGIFMISIFSVVLVMFQFYILGIRLSGLIFFIDFLLLFQLFENYSYNSITGALKSDALASYMNVYLNSGKHFDILSIYINNYTKLSNKYSDEKMAEHINNSFIFLDREFKGAIVFKEFDERATIIVPANTYDIEDMAKKVKEYLSYCDENTINLEFSIVGIRYNSSLNTKDIIKRYKSLLYKKCGHNDYIISDIDTDANFLKEQAMKEYLKDICTNINLDDDRVQIYLQPIFDSISGRFKTAEALMRLNIDGKMYFPDEFIPIAESNNYIHSLSLILLNKICKYINNLSNSNFDIDAISFNIAINEFNDDNFVDDILKIIDNNGTDYHKLRMELTESIDVVNYDMFFEKITILKNKGMEFYLDDFGTGYSNLDKILSLPLSVIKFDKSIIWQSMTNNKKEEVLADLTSLFKKQDMVILYEGIETQEMQDMAKNLGVKYLQGYIYSKPISYNDYVHFLANNK